MASAFGSNLIVRMQSGSLASREKAASSRTIGFPDKSHSKTSTLRRLRPTGRGGNVGVVGDARCDFGAMGAPPEMSPGSASRCCTLKRIPARFQFLTAEAVADVVAHTGVADAAPGSMAAEANASGAGPSSRRWPCTRPTILKRKYPVAIVRHRARRKRSRGAS